MPGNNKKVNILKPVSESHKFVTYVWPFRYHQELVLILTDRLILKLFNGYLLAKAINQKPSKTCIHFFQCLSGLKLMFKSSINLDIDPESLTFTMKSFSILNHCFVI